MLDESRQAGRGYYRELCFKVSVRADAKWTEVGDGGFTDWTARLTASNKERLLISGLGIDRVAALTLRSHHIVLLRVCRRRGGWHHPDSTSGWLDAMPPLMPASSRLAPARP